MNRSLSALLVAALAGTGGALVATTPAHATTLDPTALCASATPTLAEVQDLTTALRAATTTKAADGLRARIESAGYHLVVHGKTFRERRRAVYVYDAVHHRARYVLGRERMRGSIDNWVSRDVVLDQTTVDRWDGVEHTGTGGLTAREGVERLANRELTDDDLTSWIYHAITPAEVTTEQLIAGAGLADASGEFLEQLTTFDASAVFTCAATVNASTERLQLTATGSAAGAARTVSVDLGLDPAGAVQTGIVDVTGRQTIHYIYSYTSATVSRPTTWVTPAAWQRALVRGTTRALVEEDWTKLLDGEYLDPASTKTRIKNVRKVTKKTVAKYAKLYATKKGFSITYRTTKTGAKVTVLNRATKLRAVITLKVSKKSTSWKATWPKV